MLHEELVKRFLENGGSPGACLRDALDRDTIHNESLEMAQAASLVSALAASEASGDWQAEALALIDAARSIRWATDEERKEAQRLVERLERLLSGAAAVSTEG
jgi:hypothetical protein